MGAQEKRVIQKFAGESVEGSWEDMLETGARKKMEGEKRREGPHEGGPLFRDRARQETRPRAGPDAEGTRPGTRPRRVIQCRPASLPF